MRSLLTRTLVARLLAAAAAIAIVFAAAWLMGDSPRRARSSLPEGGAPAGARESTIAYTLPPGRSAEDVARDLEAIGAVRSALQFETLVSLMGLQKSLRAGDYELPEGASVLAIIGELTRREIVPVISVTFPEGIRIEEMAALAEEAGFGPAEDFLAAARAVRLPPDFERDLPLGLDREEYDFPQGYLFPDTYIMPEGSTAADLVALMVENLDRRFTPELRAAVRERGLTLHEALTLASIIEREAVLDEERPLMASVFFNRLAAGDMLGADPTVQYAVARAAGDVGAEGYWKQELTVEDLEIDSPYNTRKYPGLPPGPIANPGLASIEAVASPADTDLYYFVANALKGDGSHVFAETFEEHLNNIERYGR